MIQTEDNETMEPLNVNTADSPMAQCPPLQGILKFLQLREVFFQPGDSSASTTLLNMGIATDSSPSGVN